MSEELSTLEESANEVFIDLKIEKFMLERRMFAGVQASSKRGVQASPFTAHRARTSRITIETRMKHRDDLTNAKLILSILPVYIPPLSGAVNKDNMHRDFGYALVTVYFQKGVHAVRSN
jgi:hypothetical protein